MEKLNYANIANNLLGDELYYKFVKEISKENNGCKDIDRRWDYRTILQGIC